MLSKVPPGVASGSIAQATAFKDWAAKARRAVDNKKSSNEDLISQIEAYNRFL